MKTLLIFISTMLFVSGCSQSDDRQFEHSGNNRFKALETSEFLGNKAQVVVDNETGIKYLYVWEGGANGGPAITRLWEK